ncbi:MAG: hypothetical protein U9N36_02630 [Euryarchaeota archaeon]|nr:hypothetical protein [Euryarchaeota archaeon]
MDTEKFCTLKEYANDFINFLSRENRLIPESEQEKYFEENVYSYFSLIRYEIIQGVNKTIIARDVVTAEEINEIASEIIEDHYDRWCMSLLWDITNQFEEDTRKHYFERELNPQFFANYYREVENNDE